MPVFKCLATYGVGVADDLRGSATCSADSDGRLSNM